ncbi:MAG: TldD/PmbA family protein [Anaeromicrobium sp.]|jgi:PmbA protein|uniref:TldD/PmbA family protein n=1 Tax=Anaeromicrobium sp. TaxID=1929132 RepID=UPI0025ED8F32|nr:TldD/PmbA family protein [Anaeromicrobium sp.]MCT4593044.1 TldD/PmbA family protein [Anaeromicrobium sp.]
MDYRKIIKTLFDQGKIKGFEDMEVFIQKDKSLNLKVFKKEIDNFSRSDEGGLSFRGIYNGKMGYSYTEKIDVDSVELLIYEAIENSKVIDSHDEEYIFEGSKEYKKINNFNEDLAKIEIEDKIDFLKNLEKHALALDPRVDAVNYCSYGEEESYTLLVNTKGLDLENKSNIAYSYLSVVVKENDDIKTAYKYILSNDFSKFDHKKLSEEAVEEALSLLGAKSIKSNDYPVVIRNNTFANILKAFSPIFNGENVEKGLSLLKNKINKEIADQKITIVDDPFYKEGIASSFDGEGVATKYKKVVDNGILKTYLHNLKSAKNAKVASTGNAYKGSYKGTVSIAPSNMYVEKGDKSLEEILKTIDEGLMIIDVQGLHSGLNTVSGDFSLSVTAYFIKDGKIKKPVNGITMSGNFFELLKNIEEIGNDLFFTMPSAGAIGSPSIKVKKLSIAGE